MGIKVITNKDGKLETVNTPDPDPYALDRLHREVKDMIEGNTQFHDDPFSKENQEKLTIKECMLPHNEFVEFVCPGCTSSCKQKNTEGYEVTELPFEPDLWIQNNTYP